MTNNVIDVDFREVKRDEEIENTPEEEISDEERYYDLVKPIRQQILKCESRKDMLMLSSAMLHHAKDLFILELGVDATKIIFDNLKFEEPELNEEENSKDVSRNYNNL